MQRRAPRLLASALLALAACLPTQAMAWLPESGSNQTLMKIRLTVNGQSATATLYDNATARDFAALLPLSLAMEDYATIERVAGLPRKLSTQGAPDGMAPVAGELTHYAPWGNLAIFIRGRSYARSLLPLGKVNEGLPILAQPGPYQVRIERVEP
ncbi:conserved exported protein of unknown function (plasmid) [Cupriavidus taiwanensis]|uniref:Cyclophilin-like domain-containing protein n=1 Tax=Cupriavidus taiwanensis TaxID=164546 RepID=A0A9Q7V119_9BURK|nr:conserved exported protein of unknown function [Cupriavidus taiwanensis]